MPKHADGLLRISNIGCGASVNIVVNGEARGQIWTDDRGSGNGLYP